MPLHARRDPDALIFSILNPTVDGNSEIPDPVDWILENFYITEMDGVKNPPTIELYPYQRACIREALRKDANGMFVYDLVLWSDLKKSAKSSIAAAVTLYRAMHTKHGSFKIVANDLKQANSRVFEYAHKSITLNEAINKKCSVKSNRMQLPQDTYIEAVPVDPKGEAGGGDDMIEFTELHASSNKAHIRMWAEMTLSPLKRGISQRWIDTYAGYSGEAPVLEPLYNQLVTPETRFQIDDPDAPADLETYRLGGAFCLWNTKPRLPWQTPEYYASERISVLPQDYMRMHENAWSTSSSAFVPREWWAGCKVDKLPVEDSYKEALIALDAAVYDDCFGLVVLSRHGDQFAVRYAQKWTPPRGGMIDFRDVEKTLNWCLREWNVVEVTYDPTQLHDFCMRLRDRNVVRVQEFKQGAPRAIADKALRDMIRDRRIMYDDTVTGIADLTEHILNSNAKADALDPKTLRIIKRAPEMKIDLCVSLSMGSNRAEAVLSA